MSERGFVARLSPLGRLRWIRLAARREMVKAVGLVLVGDTVAVVGLHSHGVDVGELSLPAAAAGSWVATFDAASGQPRWLASFDDHVTESAALATDGHAIYVASGATDGTKLGDAGRGGRLVLGAYTVDGARLWHVESEVGGWLGGVALAVRENAVVVAATVHGRLVLEGTALDGRGDTDIAVASLDIASGAMRWARSFGGPGGDTAGGVAILGDGRVVVAGAYESEIEIVPGDLHRAVGGGDALVAVLAPDGTPQSVWTTGGVGGDVWLHILVEGDHVLLAGEGDPGFPLGAPDGGLLDAHRIVVARASIDGRDVASTAFGDLVTWVNDVALGADGNLYLGGFARTREIEGRRLRADSDGFLLELRPPWRPRP